MEEDHNTVKDGEGWEMKSGKQTGVYEQRRRAEVLNTTTQCPHKK